VRPDRPPGQGWRYSGGGYVVMQLLMEDASGMQFADWMRQRVLEPAGMVSSRFGAADSASAGDVAVGHQGLEPMPERRRIYPEQAAAGLLTTPADLARLTVALQRTLAQQPPALLDLGLLQQALSVQSRGPGVTMGLGFFLEGPEGRSGFGHNGSNQGFESSWRATPTRAVIVMANANGASELIDEIVRAVAEVHGWAEWRAVRIPWRELAACYESAPVYLRGTLNEWGTALEMRRTGARRFVVDAVLGPGRTEFKFATADWKQVNLGASYVKGDGVLRDAGGNLVLQVDRAGRYRFELDARDPERPVHRVRRLP
jgi:CubicO group peptidase (beta-lactamase class C family)